MSKEKVLFVMPDYWAFYSEHQYFRHRNAHTDFVDFFDRVDYFVERKCEFNPKVHSCLFLEGGTDINPAYYEEPRGQWTQSPNKLRDEIEVATYRKAVKHKIPVMGICRGAQLMCIANGGKMIQEVSGHHCNHPITTTEWGTFEGNCSHHQMMYPYTIDPKLNPYEIIAWAAKQYSKYYDNGNGHYFKRPKDFKEVEALWFPEQKSLGIQGHPEYVKPDHPFADWCHVVFEKYILPEIVAK